MISLPSSFIDDVEKFSKQSLKRKDDLSLIVKTYNENKRFEDFVNLCFTGKYINGLFTVLISSANIPEAGSLDSVKKDLSENLVKVTSELKKVSLMMDENGKKKIEEHYLMSNQNSLHNLRQLMEDLDQIKKYLNFLKRN